jgi:hypothetical protein
MDIAKSANASIAAIPAIQGSSGRTVQGQTAEQDSGSANETSAVVDRVDIGPLTLPAALQILLAEVRAALVAELPGLPFRPLPSHLQPNANPPLSPDHAAQRLVELYLQAVSVAAGSVDEEPAPEAREWLTQLARVDAASDAGFERALQVASGWRDVTPAVIASLQEARGIMLGALATDEAIDPAWLMRPEWLRLAPRLDRFRRLRRKLRGFLLDPDVQDPTLPFA